MKKFYKNKNFISILLSVVLSFAFVAVAAYAATTIGTNVNTGGTLTVTGAVAASSTLQVTGATTLYSTLNVTGLSTLGNATSSMLSVTGMTYLDGGLTMDTNKFTVADTSGDTSIGGTLSVTGATALSSTLGVTATTTLSSGLILNEAVACVNLYATSTATRGSLVFVTTGATSTYAGTVYWQYGACD